MVKAAASQFDLWLMLRPMVESQSGQHLHAIFGSIFDMAQPKWFSAMPSWDVSYIYTVQRMIWINIENTI